MLITMTTSFNIWEELTFSELGELTYLSAIALVLILDLELSKLYF